MTKHNRKSNKWVKYQQLNDARCFFKHLNTVVFINLGALIFENRNF